MFYISFYFLLFNYNLFYYTFYYIKSDKKTMKSNEQKQSNTLKINEFNDLIINFFEKIQSNIQ